MVVQPLHLLYMSQGVDFCWGTYIFCLIEKFSKKNWECYTRSGEKKGWVNSSFITHGTFLLPHSWLSSCDEIKIPHSRLRRSWGIFFSSRLLSHSWGSKNVPFVIHEELFFPHSSLRDSWGKNPSLFLSRPGMAHIRMSASLAQLLKIHKMLLTKVIAHMSFRYFFGITSLGHVPQCLRVGAA